MLKVSNLYRNPRSVRRTLVPFFLLICWSRGLQAQQRPAPLHFKNGIFTAKRVAPEGFLHKENLRQALFAKKYYLLLEFDLLPDLAQQQELADRGIRLDDYVADRAYLSEITDSATVADLKKYSVSGIYPVPASFKFSRKLPETGKGILGDEDRPLGVSYFGSMSREAVSQDLQEAGAIIVPTKIRPGKTLFIQASRSSLDKIASLPYVSYIAPQSLKDQSLNYNNRAAHGADALSGTSGRNLQGDGVTVGVGDNADPYTHVDFTGRQISRFADVNGGHGVHTSGTVAGGGILDPRNKGMAPHAMLVNQYFSDILVNADTYIKDYGMVLTNNSYTAYNPGCADEGEYDFLSNYLDAQLVSHPELLHVFAAGNDGAYTCIPYTSPYATIKSGYQSAKNVLTVGNMSNWDYTINYSSSCGPVTDGRLKPEIVAGGVNILSTLPNNTYGYSSGTSMASPTVTGSLTLFTQRYRQLHGGANPPAALVKALVCNNATDLGNPGPDFVFGFGSLNIRAAVEALENNQYYTGTINNAGVNTFTLSGIPAGLQQIRILLYWPDVPASPYAAAALVNNLDLTVSGSDAVLHRPLILNPATGHVNDPAVEGTDNLNNIEQVVINNPPGGSFTITVKGTNIPGGPQNYIVAYQTIKPSVTLQYPYGDETWVPGESEIIRWTAAGGEPNTFNLEFSGDNGSSWSPVNSAPIPADTRMYTWTVPASVTGQGLIRVTRNVVGYSDVSHPFTILGQPVLTATNPCQGYAKLIWKTIPSATAYDIMQLKGDSMQKIGTTTDTSILLGSLRRDSSYYWAVRAVNGSIAGRRSIAANLVPSGGSCALTALDNDHSIDSLISPGSSGRIYTSTQLSATTPIRVELKNLGTIPSGAAMDLSYRVNGGAIVTESSNAVITPNGVYNYTFAQPFDFSATGVYLLQVWVSYPGDPQAGNDTLTKVIRQLPNDPIVLAPAYTEGFEGAVPASYTLATLGLTGIDRYDFSASNANGRVRTFVNSGFARTGDHCATLDQQHYSTITTTDSLITTFNLSNYSASDQLWLNFFYRNHGIDSAFAGNRVWIRGNDQAAWLPVYTLDNSYVNIGVYQPSSNIDIRQILSAASPAQAVSSSFQVKFGEQGHTSANSVITDGDLDDGYSFDDITLTRATNDAGILSLTGPDFSHLCNLSGAEIIKIKVRNYGSATLSNIPVSYSINGVSVTEQIPSINGFDSVTYTFSHGADLSAYLHYTLKAWVSAPGDNYAFNDSLMPVLFQTTPLISSYPYLENFENGDGHWYTGGTNSSWEWGTPVKATIHQAAGGAKCWVTHLSGNYNDNELSYLYSPCLDLSSLTHPVLSFSHIFQMEDNCTCDYHWVEYSLDGVTWIRLGSVGSGMNWYDNPMRQAWQISDTSWHVSSLDLPVNAAKVRLRFVLNSDGGTNFEGVGIDDIHIFEKTSIYSGANINSGLSQPVSGNQWIHFDMGGRRVASINPNGQDLGNTTVKAFINSGPVRNDSVQYYLDRNIVIQPSNLPARPVSVRYYFLDTEVNTLKGASGCPTCTTLADAYQAGVTQYSSALTAEEDSTLNNDISGQFRFFLPRQDLHIVPYDNGYYAEYAVSSFSEFWINNGGPGNDLPLPNNLLSFTAVRSGTTALLQWSTSRQAGARTFVMEKGKDGSLFNVLDSVNTGAGNPPLNYRYTDPHPGKGITYYRLKMVDSGGRFTYSPIRTISDTTGPLSVTVYPNPIHSGNLFISSNANCRHIGLIDVSGRVIMQTDVHGYFNTLLLPALSRGIYFLRVDTDSGRTVVKVSCF